MICLNILWTTIAQAQLIITSGKMAVCTTGTLTVNSDFINQDSLISGGKIYATGHWSNTGNYISNQEHVFLQGTQPQIMDQHGQGINSLTVNNSTGISLQSKLVVEKSLDLQNGIVLSGNEGLWVNDSAEIIGGNAQSFIEGVLFHQGEGEKFFPIGAGTQYAPFYINNIQGTAPVLGVSFSDQPLSIQPPEYFELEEFYWQLWQPSGKISSAEFQLLAKLGGVSLEDAQNYSVMTSESQNNFLEPITNVKVGENSIGFTYSGALNPRARFFTLGRYHYPESIVYIPNAVSPLAPNPEDQSVKIYSHHLIADGFQWTVWDAWGHVVYHTRSLTEASETGWQSQSSKGKAGIYKYRMSAKLDNGQVFNKSGNIVLYE